MAKRQQKSKATKTMVQELVAVTFTEDIQQAKEYETLLKNNEIPAMTKKHHENGNTEENTIAIMVPEEYLDEAHVVIESQDAYDDFYDLAIDDNDDDDDALDFDTDVFDDDY